MAKWRQLVNKTDYKRAVDRLNILMDTARSDEVQNELTLLSLLVEEFEESYYPMPDATPQEVIKFVMEMKGIMQKDLIPILGTKGNVSKILSGAAKIQLEMLDPLAQFLGISVEALIPKGKSSTTPKPFERQSQIAVAESSVQYGKKKN